VLKTRFKNKKKQEKTGLKSESTKRKKAAACGWGTPPGFPRFAAPPPRLMSGRKRPGLTLAVACNTG